MTTIFITGSARSGTTSLLEVLGKSKFTQIALEPEPSLNFESRELYEGRLTDPYSVLARDVVPRVARALNNDKVYIEKHVSLVPFIPYLAGLLDCKFLIPIRDGRDVVASLLNWHNQMFPIIYQECHEQPTLGEHARKILENQQGADPFDYSLPRPSADDPWFVNWKHFNRFEMVSWYWAFINRYLFKQIRQLSPDRYLIVNYSQITPKTIQEVYDFIGLPDYNEKEVTELLKGRVNSLEYRIGETGKFPYWPSWPEEQQQRFQDIAFETMTLLGFTESECRTCPSGFGEWWHEEKSVDANWYAEIYRYRTCSHETFKRWVEKTELTLVPFESVIDVGSGIGYGYSEFFKEKSFTGIDLSARAIRWSNERNTYTQHQYICADIIKNPPSIHADLVFSQATIDNLYDMDAFLRGMAKMTKKILYIVNYRGYFNGMQDHRYVWDPKMRVCFNDISVSRAIDVLYAEGFKTVVAFPMATQREDIKSETVIIASREECDPYGLMAEHELYFDFQPYQVQPSGLSLQMVIDQINLGCAYFSESGLNLANPLEYFRNMLSDLRTISSRHFGTNHALATKQGSVNTAIRVDIDMDLVAAREMARIAAEECIPLSFYILHTAPYYGTIRDGIFYRNEANADLYLEMQQLGAEIGLHVDPLELYLKFGIEGAEAVKTELAWLRNIGLSIRGTSAHNCAPVYGAENFEIFKGRSINKRSFYQRKHTYIPLEILDEQALGLDYEASLATPALHYDPAVRETYLEGLPKGDFIRDERWFRLYILDNPYCNWGYHFNIWLLGKDFWAIAGRGKDKQQTTLHFGVSWKTVKEFLSDLHEEEQVVLVLHGIYLGQRLQAGDPPIGAINNR